jgi:hypothetical protein
VNAETPGRAIARVCKWGWDTPYGEQNASVRVLPATARPL